MQSAQFGILSPKASQRTFTDTKTKISLDSQTSKRIQMTHGSLQNQKQSAQSLNSLPEPKGKEPKSVEFELEATRRDLLAAQKERDNAIEELLRFKQNCRCSELDQIVENLQLQLVKKTNMLSEITLKEQELHKAYDINMSKMVMKINKLKKEKENIACKHCGKSSPSSHKDLEAEMGAQRLEEEVRMYREQMDQMRELMRMHIPLIETLISASNRTEAAVSSQKNHGSPPMAPNYVSRKINGLYENETVQKLRKFAEQIKSQIDELEKFGSQISATDRSSSIEKTLYNVNTPISRNRSPSPFRPSSNSTQDTNTNALQKERASLNGKKTAKDEPNSRKNTPKSMNSLPASDPRRGKGNGELSNPQSLTQLTPKNSADTNGSMRPCSPITEMVNKIRQDRNKKESNPHIITPKTSGKMIDGSSQSVEANRLISSDGFDRSQKHAQEEQPSSFSWNYQNFKHMPPLSMYPSNQSFGQPLNMEGESEGSFKLKKHYNIPLLNFEKSNRGSEDDSSSLVGRNVSNNQKGSENISEFGLQSSTRSDQKEKSLGSELKDKNNDTEDSAHHLLTLRRNVDTYWIQSNKENARDVHQPCKHYAHNLEHRLDSLEDKLNLIESHESAIRKRIERFEQDQELKLEGSANKDIEESTKIKSLEAELENLKIQLQELGRISQKSTTGVKILIIDDPADSKDLDKLDAQEKEGKTPKNLNSPKSRLSWKSLAQIDEVEFQEPKPKIRKATRRGTNAPDQLAEKPTDIETVQDERVKELEKIVKSHGESLKLTGVEDCGLILGIDCTISNISTGKKSFSQHHLHDISSRKLNFYEKVISIMGSFVELFSDDGRFPVYIFGDDKTRDKRVRPLYQDKEDYEECFGVSHALAEYRKQIPKICLSGPTSFKPLIQTAIEITKIKEQFQILIIIGDGAVTDMNETIQSIVEASEYPILIIMVGVGDGEYKKHPQDPWLPMKKLEQEIPQRKFMNFHFIQFNKGMKPQEFAEKAISKVSSAYKYCLDNGMILSEASS